MNKADSMEHAKEASRIAREKRKESVKAIRKQVCADYPDIFNTQSPKPLAIGIHKALFEKYPQHSHKNIRLMLGRWVNHPAYRRVHVQGADRYNLDGTVFGRVEKKHIVSSDKKVN